ncbi:glycine betaine/proline transport system substrate-binding protein [Saccharopolyspora erythraea NRRL 2338]|uniref:Glycine betaine transport system permease protein n=2 Tax=Saccharopolyspora erythraea TaxID=1836 RepID=A4FBV3_SACEN|nr:glycine/betaine ABC transporter substrate-binding protein [Saccharopolyspora erythraea D]PFG95302.1 glycine betaine/proline transport system substrate-binding protein [Saccharopolyspora erythraea NRRL 2338]QRK91949.1 glycine betaine ABC transporter substrate-binding protein [Saccharopolyspora erythraea]CAM01528.1 glycine betaine transport system permease protein [Saccharopolyspora erythraea NRRL 2338]
MLMRTRAHRLTALLAALCALVLVAAGCGGRQAETGQEAKRITIGYIAWDEDIAVTNLFKVLLEEQGYQVTTTELEAGPVYAGLAQGNIDLFLDAWLPETHSDYWKQYSGQIEDLGVWYDQATLNIAVPNYLTDINSIADLKGRSGQFGGVITGIDPGAGLSRITKNNAIPQYQLDYTLQTSSTTAMLASLEKAINEHKPIVVTLWHPHWAYARYPIKDLQDPLGAMGQAEEIHSVGRAGFSQDFPQVTEMVKKFRLDDQTLSSLENAVNSAPKGQEAAAARKWADENPQVISAFAPGQ